MAAGRVNTLIITNRPLVLDACRRAVERAGAEVLRDAKDLAPRSTLQAPVKDPSRPVTGNLGNSISMDVQVSGDEAVATVGTTVHYGIYQEFGTRSIPARPYLGPALEKARRKYGRR